MKINQSFPHDCFLFVHKPIRTADATNRNFLERFMLGMQSQFEDAQTKINQVMQLLDARRVPANALRYLKDHVGFTKELDYITQGLTDDEIRKLIILAVPLWRQKGLELGYKNVIRLFTGAGSRIFNWFDFRLIVGEKSLGEEQLGEDSWLISVPGVEGSNPVGGVVLLISFEDNFKDRSLTKNDPVYVGSLFDHNFYDGGAVAGSDKHVALAGGRLRVPANAAYDFEGSFTIEGFFRTTVSQSATLFRTENESGSRVVDISLDTSTNELAFTAQTEDIVANDESDYNNDGEFEGDLVPIVGGDPSITGSTRRLQGNATDQSLTFAYGEQYDFLADFTIEFAVKRAAAPGSTRRVLGKQISAANVAGSYRIDATATGLQISIRDFVSLSDDTYTIASASVFDNAWHRVAFVRTGTQLYTYLDGSRINIASLANTGALDAEADLILLKRVGDTLFDDTQIDELRMSNIARYTGASYVVASAEFTSDDDTVLLAHFDESDVVTETISSGDSLDDNDWRHWALVVNKETGRARMWLDGSESTSEIEIGLRDLTTFRDLFIAAQDSIGTNPYTGDLDNIRLSLSAVYDTSLATITPPGTTFVEYIEEQLDEFQTDIRVVDIGNLNRDLLLKVLNLMRPVSERLNVIYIKYFEDFEIGKGSLQTIAAGSSVVDGELLMPAGSIEHSDFMGDDELQNIFLSISVVVPEAGRFGIRFNIQNNNDFYRVLIDTTDSTMRLQKVVAGVSTTIHGPVTVDLVPDTQYVMSVSTFIEPSTNVTKIKYFQDSNLVGEVDDNTYDKGKFGIEAQLDSATVREMEAFTKPLETNRINPNFEVL